jgi:leucyl-tRNA synthetase
VAALMEFVNTLAAHAEQHGPSPAFQEATGVLIRLLAPFAPHIAEELWAQRGGTYSVHEQPWPDYDPALTVRATTTLIIEVNGKVKDRIVVPADIDDDEACRQALGSERVQHSLQGRRPCKVIIVPGRLVNVVV